jgi:hypothetical protein
MKMEGGENNKTFSFRHPRMKKEDDDKKKEEYLLGIF